jgi:hypothetical protein
MSSDRTVSLLSWLRDGSGPDFERQVQAKLRDGGAEAELIRRYRSRHGRGRGESPNNKALTAPQTK